MKNIKVIKNISKLYRYNNFLYRTSDVIPYGENNKYHHYLRMWSDLITNYGSIAYVDMDGSVYEDYLISEYNERLEFCKFFFSSCKTKFIKSKVKHYSNISSLKLSNLYLSTRHRI